MNTNESADVLQNRIENMFLHNSKISMFKDIIPEVFDAVRDKAVSESLGVQIESAIKTALLSCKSQGRDFIVYPKFDLEQRDNAIMRITDFIYDDIASQAMRNIKFNITYDDSGYKEGK